MTSTSVRVLGADVSKWQDSNSTPYRKIDFFKMKSMGVKFVFIKASQNNFDDEDFSDYWRDAKEAGIMRGAYHLYEYRNGAYPALYQANKFLEIMNGDYGELGLVLDYERPNSSWPPLPSKTISLATIYSFTERIETYTKEPTIFYCNQSFIRDHLGYNGIPSWLSAKPLWMAKYPYLEVGSFPSLYYTLPVFPWTIKFWQFTDRLKGGDYGVESMQMDGDFFLGTETELRNFRSRNRRIYRIYLPNVYRR